MCDAREIRPSFEGLFFQGRRLLKPSLLAGVLLIARLAIAGEPPRQAEPDFSPPPVPEFMLRKPDTPLTLDEMRRQADEAAARVRARPSPAELPPGNGMPADAAGRNESRR